MYFHMSTLATYTEYPLPELTFKVEKNQCIKLASLRQVFASLTQNAKQIFEEIAKRQIKEDVDPSSADTGKISTRYARL